MRTILILSIIALFLAAGCVQQGSQGAGNEKVFTVGAIQPLTGEGAVYGLPVQRVVQQAVADLNAQWEDKNQRLEIIYEDGKCNGKDALLAAQNLVDVKGVQVIYGGTCSGETLGFSPFTEQNEVLVFSPLSSSPQITTAGDFVFRNYPSDSAQVQKMVPFLAGQGIKTVGILSENTDYAQALKKAYEAQLPDAGIEVVASEVAVPNTKDVRTEVLKIKSAKPDAVIMLPQTIPTAGIFVSQVVASKVDAVLVGNDIAGLQDVLNDFAAELEGMYAPSSVFEREDSDEFALLQEQTDCQLGFYCATTYDGIFLLGEILEKCGDSDTVCMRDALYATQGWEGTLSGETSIDENGDVPGAFQVNQVVDGAWVKIE